MLKELIKINEATYDEEGEPVRKKTEPKAEQPKTKTREERDKNLEDLFRRSQQQHTATRGDLAPVKPKVEPKVEPKTTRKHKLAGAEKTRSKVGQVSPSEEMMNKLSSIDHTATDEISDAEAARRAGLMHGDHPVPPIQPETLPAVINKHLVVAGMIEPEWHMVKHLPGYLSSAIRSIGRAVFAPFTKTPIEEIQVLANLGGQGPNEKKELNAVLGHLVKHATRDRDAEIIFHDKIPDYGADIKVFKDHGITYMAVKDFAGEYIYAWPTGHEHAALEIKKDAPKRLTKESFAFVKEAKKLGKTIQPRDPNFKALEAIRKSGASGAHFNKKTDFSRSKEKVKFRKELDS